MFNKKVFATTTGIVLLASTAAIAEDLGSSEFSAGVSLMSPEDTGFLYTASVDTTGLGDGAVSISGITSTFDMTGFASSAKATGTDEATAKSGVLSAFTFNRTVAARGSSAGVGQVISKGSALGSVGAQGSAYGETLTNAIVDGDTGKTTSTSGASSTSSASLIGTGTTDVVAGLLGSNSKFVGDAGTSVTTTQSGIAYSGLNASGDAKGTGLDITKGTGTDFTTLSSALDNLAVGAGVIGYNNTLSLGSGNAGAIDLAVSNVGGGSISLGVKAGGFFSGGAATGGTSAFGSVFDAIDATTTSGG